MKHEGKIYQIKEYSEFGIKKDNDEVIREFPDLETAQFESVWLNNKARLGERYYVIDSPHDWIELTEPQREKLKKNYGIT